MAQPRVLILRAPGTNCDAETAFAFQTAGAATEVVHLARLLESPQLLSQFQILCLPGGFSYGDDIAAGRIFGNQIRHHLAEVMQEFRAAERLILGICNGFQVMIKCGLFDTPESNAASQATLTWNESGRFEDRWVHLRTDGDRSVFLRGIEKMYLPIAHAEGHFVTSSEEVLSQLQASGQLVLRYCREDYTPGQACDDAILPHPYNPNGSLANVAGISDSTGRVFGLMPHPERHIDPTHHPRWTRTPAGERPEVGEGLQVFVNAVEHFA